jgi:hypothetical protein
VAGCPRPTYNRGWAAWFTARGRNQAIGVARHHHEPAGPGQCSLCANAAIAHCDRCRHLICLEHRRLRRQFRWQHRGTSADWYGQQSTWKSYELTGGEWSVCPACDAAIAREDKCALAIDRRERCWRVGCASVTLALYGGGMLAAVVLPRCTGSHGEMPRRQSPLCALARYWSGASGSGRGDWPVRAVSVL